MDFILGCNYWASNAGTEMWVEWDTSAIDRDLERLSAHGLRYLRVFPNWRDFQPVCAYYGVANLVKEYRHRNGSFFDNPYYIDMEMMRRFEHFCQIADKHGMKLIVGILTGWMSGRTFTPPLLEGRNLYTDETALLMEQKYVKGFVSYLGGIETIFAWDLGNECNCLSKAENREVAASWTAMMVNAIRGNDGLRRPVISGMHGLGIQTEWTIFDQGENVDLLTTHPYPHFVEHCFKDDMLSFRTLLHATCEGVYYSNLGGKPCLTEEIGTLGPMTCDDAVAAAFLKTNLYSNWANGSRGVLWWCGCEQVELKTAPYSWCMMERELGLLDRNSEPRKTLLTYRDFSLWLEKFGKQLPKAHTDAVCVLTEKESHWGTAYMTYALAKQSHMNLQFIYGRQRTLPESDIYLMPSIEGPEVICKETFDMLLERVYRGAILYISNDTGYLAEFEHFSGIHIRNSMMIHETCTMQLGEEEVVFERNKRYFIESHGAEVIAYDSLGMPVFTKYTWGKGTVYYLNFPLETMLLNKNYAFDSNYYKIYSRMFEEKKKQRPINVGNHFIGMTCHYEEQRCHIVLINYSDQEQKINMSVNNGYRIVEVLGGDAKTLLANEAAIVTCVEMVPEMQGICREEGGIK